MQSSPSCAARAIATLGSSDGFGRSDSADATYLHIRSAGHQHEVFEPFTPEQQELVDWLTGQQADKALCVRAWNAFDALN